MDYFAGAIPVLSAVEEEEKVKSSIITTTERTTPPSTASPLPSKTLGEVLTNGSARISVLNETSIVLPPAQSRFLHGGHALSDLDAPSVVILPSVVSTKAVAVSSSNWRCFTDREEEKLQTAWKELGKDDVNNVDGNKEGKLDAGAAITDPDEPTQPHIVPVGLDRLFSVNLNTLILTPDFWSGSSVRVIKSLWFYAPPSSSASSSSSSTPTPSHLMKCYPVDAALGDALEKAYKEVKPFQESYAEELKSALRLGPLAESKLRVSLMKGGEGNTGGGIEVIFQDSTLARVYSTGVLGSIGKSFFSSNQAFGGGQVVLRGFEAFKNYRKGKKSVEKNSMKESTSRASTPAQGDESEEADAVSNSTPSRSRASSTSGSPPRAPKVSSPTSTSTSSSTLKIPNTINSSPSLFETLKSKLNVATSLASTASTNSNTNDLLGKKSVVNDTQEAMDGLRNKEAGLEEDADGCVKEPEELVLVIHGIGQRLSESFDSLNFVYSVNQLRTNCTKLSTSSLAPLLQSKRAQFIPVRWRTDLEFNDDDDDLDHNEELGERNRFNLEDIEIDSVPFLRQLAREVIAEVPLYLSHYKVRMIAAVCKDANRIYRLFCARNPSFAKNGKVSIIAHSLGSALTADILSSQVTFVKPLIEMSIEEQKSETQFIFDTRNCFLVGSPLAFFLHLGRGQLIARRGRERTQNAERGIALSNPRYGCLSADAVYNIYNSTDPVAFSLNATVDSNYASKIKPIAIPSSNVTLVQNLSETYSKVTKLFDVANLWGGGGGGSSNVDDDDEFGEVGEVEKLVRQKLNKDKDKEGGSTTRKRAGGPPPPSASAASTTSGIKRPGKGLKRLPSERPMSMEEYEKVSRAEKRFNALNPHGCVDFYMPPEGLSTYLESIVSHNNYWQDNRFATFILTQLFSSIEDLEKTGREEIATAD